MRLVCIFHEEFCEKDKFAYHIVDILRNLLFFMVYLLWTVFIVAMAFVVVFTIALGIAFGRYKKDLRLVAITNATISDGITKERG